MFKKLKLWYAHYQLAKAVEEEANSRLYAKHLREEVIPALEKVAYDREMDLLTQQFVEGNRQ